MAKAGSTEKVVREIRRHTRRRFSAEEKIRIVLEGLRGEESIAARCRREGLNPNIYYRWSKSIKSFTDVQERLRNAGSRFRWAWRWTIPDHDGVLRQGRMLR